MSQTITSGAGFRRSVRRCATILLLVLGCALAIGCGGADEGGDGPERPQVTPNKWDEMSWDGGEWALIRARTAELPA